MFNIKRYFIAAFVFCLGFASVLANEAVFSNDTKAETINVQPVSESKIETNAPEETNAADVKKANDSLSNEKFKSAVNNLESAEVDVREQLSSYKSQVDAKIVEVNARKSELSTLKKEYKALQKKMKNIDKMKKMLNNNII